MNQVISAQPAAPTPTMAGIGRGGQHRYEVMNEWIARSDDERFLNLTDLRKYCFDKADESMSAVVRNRDVRFLAPDHYESIEDTRKLNVALPDDTVANFSNWSFQQAAQLTGAPAAYLRTLPSGLVADCLTWGVNRNREVEDLKAYYQPNGDRMRRALTGPKYGRINDYELVDAVMEIAGTGRGEMGWKVPGRGDWGTGVYDPDAPVSKRSTTLYAGDRDVFIFLVDDRNPIVIGKLPNGDDDVVFRGFYCWNSEVGSKSLGIACMYIRWICDNRILWNVEGFQEMRIVHSSQAPDRFIAEAAPALRSFAEGSTVDLLAGVNAAKAAKVASDDDEALAWLNGRVASRSQARAVLDRVQEEEGHPARSVWDMAQGITSLARDLPHQDSRVDLERRARVILDKVA